MPSICWNRLTSKRVRLQPLWAKLRDVVDPSLRVDIAVEQRFLAKSRNFTRSLYAEHLNSVHMIEAASHAQAMDSTGCSWAAGTTRSGRHARCSTSRSRQSTSSRRWPHSP